MDASEWKKIKEEDRKDEDLPLSLFYEYYKDMREGKTIITLEAFEQAFPQFLQYTMGGMIQTKNGIKFVDFNSIVNKVYTHFNNKFIDNIL